MTANRIGLLVAILTAFLARPLALRAQAPDTTSKYPWRMSYFPYFTVSPNDGLMGLGRVVFFRQSRWDDRVSLTDEVAIEGGYSTKDAWLGRVKGDFPRIAPGWRLQVLAEGARTPHFLNGSGNDLPATRVLGAVEVSRNITKRLYLAGRISAVNVHRSGEFAPVGFRDSASSFDVRARLALVYDRRDREFDTRRGYLFEAGGLGGSASGGHSGFYAIFSMWREFRPGTRLAVRAGFRQEGPYTVDAQRVVPGWENEFVVGGGPNSNRGLAVANYGGQEVHFESLELRQDMLTLPAAAVALIGFVDATRNDTSVSELSTRGWVVSPGGGIAIRLLRNAILTSTVGFAEGKARFYVSSGWSW